MGPESFLKTKEQVDADLAAAAEAHALVTPTAAEVDEHGGPVDSDTEWVKVWSAADGREAHRHSKTGAMRFRRGEGDPWVSPEDGHAPWVSEDSKKSFSKSAGAKTQAVR